MEGQGHKYAESNHVLDDNDLAWNGSANCPGSFPRNIGQDIKDYMAPTFPPLPT